MNANRSSCLNPLCSNQMETRFEMQALQARGFGGCGVFVCNLYRTVFDDSHDGIVFGTHGDGLFISLQTQLNSIDLVLNGNRLPYVPCNY